WDTRGTPPGAGWFESRPLWRGQHVFKQSVTIEAARPNHKEKSKRFLTCPKSPSSQPGIGIAADSQDKGRLTLRFPPSSSFPAAAVTVESNSASLVVSCCRVLCSVFGPLCIRVRGATEWFDVSSAGEFLPEALTLQRLGNPFRRSQSER